MEIMRGLRDVLRKLKHRKVTPKFCPKCGSSNIKLSSKLDVWLTPEQYVCTDCGYRGPVIMELDGEE